MTAILLLLLAPALLLCALKLSLVERVWEVLPPALVVAAVPLAAHGFAVRASLAGVEQAMTSPEALNTFAVLLALEAIVTLALMASIMTAHSRFTAGAHEAGGAGREPVYATFVPAAAAVFIAGRILERPILQTAGLLALAGLTVWPWLPRGWRGAAFARWRPANGARYAAMAVTPLWALLSPAGLAAIAGVQMRLLTGVAGIELWRVSAGLAAGLFAGLAAGALLLRYAAPNWRTRLGVVMLLGLVLLMGSMFMPQFFSSAPPPASAITVNGPATCVFAGLAGFAVLATNLPRAKRGHAGAQRRRT